MKTWIVSSLGCRNYSKEETIWGNTVCGKSRFDKWTGPDKCDEGRTCLFIRNPTAAELQCALVGLYCMYWFERQFFAMCQFPLTIYICSVKLSFIRLSDNQHRAGRSWDAGMWIMKVINGRDDIIKSELRAIKQSLQLPRLNGCLLLI